MTSTALWPALLRARQDTLRAQHTAVTSFAAFREHHYQPYLQYAALRIGQDGAAQTAVAAAFTELAVRWTAILGGSGPAAVAWDILHHHVDHAADRRGRAGADPGRQTLRQDAQLLHQQLQLSSERVAELLGIPSTDVSGLLPPGP